MKGSFTASLRVEGSDPDRLEMQLDRVMEELIRLGVEDPAIGGTLSTGEVEISITVEAESLEDAVPKAMTALRAAIHAADGATPGWPRSWSQQRGGGLQVDWEKLTLVPA
jgi:hypothetical protein